MEEKRSGYRILVADDDRNVHQSLSAYFRRDDYQLISAYDGRAAINAVAQMKPDLILLDIMMPVVDGFDVCREIRKSSSVPIIMLSAKGEEFDKLLGLEIGADDYVTKPFSPREVVARIKAVLRRLNDSKAAGSNTHLVITNLDIDISAYIVRLDGEQIACTSKEIEILWTLASNPDMVFSREKLLQRVWGYDFLGDTRAIDSHIKRIRAKLCTKQNPWDIKTVWGVGYRFEVTDN